PRLDADFLVADSKFMKVAFGVGFKMIAVPSSGIVTTSRYVVPTGRVKVPAGRYVVPTGKDNVIVSAGRTKVIPADQLNVEAEAVEIILTRINNDIYSIVDVCPNACEMWKAIKRLKQGEQINVQDLETNLYWEFGKFTSRDGESLESYYSRMVKNEVNEIRTERLACTANPLALVSQQQPVYHPQNHPTHYTNNSSTRSQQAAIRNRGKLNAEQADLRDDIDDELKDQELEAHYMYMAQIQEVILDDADNSRPIFDAEPLQKVQNNDDNYNMFAIKSEHPEQPESVNDTYPVEQDEHNIIIDSLDMSYDREKDDEDDNDDLVKERDLLASLIEKLKCKIDDSKNRNKLLETSNKALVDKLKDEIKDFKTKNKSLQLSNNHFKEANNKLSKTNQLMFKDLKNFQDELDRYHDVNYASKEAIDYAKPKGDLMSYKMESEKSFNEYT
ncbi:hypothetical protein Tco_0702309, partial [Tanacetum coccineum]